MSLEPQERQNSSNDEDQIATEFGKDNLSSRIKSYAIHSLLFLLTFASVSYAGILWVGKTGLYQDFWLLFKDGAVFAALLLSFLASHEFGHYFAAKWHKIKVSLPYFIPVPFLGIGTLGAVIRIKEPIYSTKKLFDVGIAGPIAGFVVALFILIYGFSTLPDASYIHQFEGHESVKSYIAENGVYPKEPLEKNEDTLFLGSTLLFEAFLSFFEASPPLWELYHYPWLFAGWLGLFFTALNLTPVGQLDGGHILYGLIGRKGHALVSKVIVFGLSILAGMGAMGSAMMQDPFSVGGAYIGIYWIGWALALIVVFRKLFQHDQVKVIVGTSLSMLISALLLWSGYIKSPESYLMWLIWLIFLTFFAGIDHPPVVFKEKLDQKRTILGWFSMLLYLLCFTLNPIYTIAY